MNSSESFSGSRELYETLNHELLNFTGLIFVLILFLLICFFVYKRRVKKRSEAELESLRQKISCDLHDEIGVNLAGISLMTECLKKKYASDIELHGYLDEIRHAASETDIATQEIVALLENKKEFKLEAYFKKIFDRYCSRYQSKIEIDPEINFKKISIEKRRHLLLYFKEALHNILRHSQAKTIEISLMKEKGRMVFKILDDGIGFDCRDPGKLKKLKQRSEQLQCDLFIDSEEAKGTKLTLMMADS
jgi:signal transduction histidine kinase